MRKDKQNGLSYEERVFEEFAMPGAPWEAILEDLKRGITVEECGITFDFNAATKVGFEILDRRIVFNQFDEEELIEHIGMFWNKVFADGNFESLSYFDKNLGAVYYRATKDLEDAKDAIRWISSFKIRFCILCDGWDQPHEKASMSQ